MGHGQPGGFVGCCTVRFERRVGYACGCGCGGGVVVVVVLTEAYNDSSRGRTDVKTIRMLPDWVILIYCSMYFSTISIHTTRIP